MVLRLRQWFVGAIAVLGIAFGGAAVIPAGADAWYGGNVYLVVGNNHCPNSGHVTGVFGAVDWFWKGGDWGDNIIYPRVRIRDRNEFNGRAYCQAPWWLPSYFSQWINVVGWGFYPSYNRQTFWY